MLSLHRLTLENAKTNKSIGVMRRCLFDDRDGAWILRAGADKRLACLMPPRRADLAGVVPQPMTFPEHHEACVLCAAGIRRGHGMPAPTAWAVQLVAGLEWFVHTRKVLRGRTAESHGPADSKGAMRRWTSRWLQVDLRVAIFAGRRRPFQSQCDSPAAIGDIAESRYNPHAFHT